MVQAWRSELFGLGTLELKEIEELSEPILALLLRDERNAFTQAVGNLEKLTDLLTSSVNQGNGLIKDMTKSGLSLDTVLNVVIDSYLPVLNGLKLVLFRFYSNGRVIDLDESSVKRFIEECLSLTPPFRYISRHVAGNKTCWYSVDIAACCANDHGAGKLYFGSGAHYCPGARIAQSFLVHMLRFFAEERPLGDNEVLGETTADSGMFDVAGFNLRRRL